MMQRIAAINVMTGNRMLDQLVTIDEEP